MFGTRAVLEEIRDLRGEIRELHSENADMLRFMGEVIRRNERAFIESRDESRAAREETRAQTRAIFALIDRLKGDGTAPAM